LYKQLRVAVVVPAFNEERKIRETVRTVPGFVDLVVVVDDASRDATGREARAAATAVGRRDVEIVRHRDNRGVGAAIVTGYRRALGRGADVVAVMAGDGQMAPEDLPRLLDPIAAGTADYVKGNRFARPEVWRVMPRARLAGNMLLSLATRVTSGYWRMFDSQCGYTVASRRALEAVDLGRMFPRYGYPNDLLARLNAAGMRVVDVPVRAVYGPGWRSGISPSMVLYPISFVLMRSWGERIFVKYVRGGRRRDVDGDDHVDVNDHVDVEGDVEERCGSG
jgi:glycosyltransferase involved in cell wall biosynthesis